MLLLPGNKRIINWYARNINTRIKRYSNVNPSKIKKGIESKATKLVLRTETSSFCRVFVFIAPV